MKHTLTYLYCGTILALASHAAGVDFSENDVAVHVNNENISTREVETAYADSFLLIQDKIRSGELRAADISAAIRVAWTDALDSAIQDKIIDQRADAHRRDIIRMYMQRAGQVMSGEKALEMFRRLESDYLGRLRKEMIAASGGEDELRKALKRRGQTLEQWENNLEKELFRRDVIAMELGPIVVHPYEIKEYFEKHPDQFGQPEAWRLRRFRLSKKRFGDPETAYEAILKVKQKIEKEGKFDEIAANLSDDKEYGDAGGLMTRNHKTDLPSGNFPAEEQIAAKLKDGQISAPIDAGEWYELIQRQGHQDARTLRFEEASDRAEGLAYMEKVKARKREMYEKLKRLSYIEILRKDPPERLLTIRE